MKCQHNNTESRVCTYFRADCFFRGCSHPKAWPEADKKGKSSIRPMKFFETPAQEKDNPPKWCPLLEAQTSQH